MQFKDLEIGDEFTFNPGGESYVKRSRTTYSVRGTWNEHVASLSADVFDPQDCAHGLFPYFT